jgi:inosose dehydratase
MKFGFGTQLWLRDDHFENWYRMLDEMSLGGLDGFEMCYPYVIEHYEQRVGELRTLLAMHDLELASYYTYLTYADPDACKHGVAEVERRCRFMAELGAQNILLDGGRKRPGQTPQELDDEIKIIAETANHLGEYARSCGLTLSWHQHWGSILEVQAPFHRFMELTDPAVVGFCCDVGQLLLGDFDPVETVKRYVSRIRFMHYKDVSFAGRPQDGELWPGSPQLPSDGGAYNVDSRGRWIELGRGAVDFPGVTQVLREAGYDGWLVDDFDFTGYAPRVSVQACKDYINLGLSIWTERDIRCGLAPR